MQSVTFIGEVRQGRLYPSGPLAEFDGKQVLVTVIAPDGSLTPATPQAPVEEAPAELDVETEVYAPMPVTAQNLGPRPIHTAAASPCLIFPEESTDE
jgi:hypothetical protein